MFQSSGSIIDSAIEIIDENNQMYNTKFGLKKNLVVSTWFSNYSFKKILKQFIFSQNIGNINKRRFFVVLCD